MTALSKKPIEPPTDPNGDSSNEEQVRITNQSMNSTHTCPCCSNNLVRQMRSEGLYWFCSHCHQEMPV